jgi:hypothetical protein
LVWSAKDVNSGNLFEEHIMWYLDTKMVVSLKMFKVEKTTR